MKLYYLENHLCLGQSTVHPSPLGMMRILESAEIDMMEQRHHNVGRISFGYLKALEIIMNDLIIGHIKRSGFSNDFYVDTTTKPHARKLREPRTRRTRGARRCRGP